MRGKAYNYVVYSEYSGDTVIDEQDRCLIDSVHKKGEAKLDTKTVNKAWEVLDAKLISDHLNLQYNNNWLEFENIYKGEEKLLKIIIKNKETGKQKCVDIPKERENFSTIEALKVGMTVYYLEKMGMLPEIVEIVKIVNDRPLAKTLPGDWIPYPWQIVKPPFGCRNMYPRRAGRATFTKEYLDELIQRNEERQERRKYQERPYFNVKLDPIKGQSDNKENLEKMEFPCWVSYKRFELGKDRIGMLVTGCPYSELEYQLIDMNEQVPVGEVCTINRDTDLKALIDKFQIEVIKGESQLWKIGKFNV